jgi:hypothetical protein
MSSPTTEPGPISPHRDNVLHCFLSGLTPCQFLARGNFSANGALLMQKYLIATVFVLAAVTPAFAAEHFAAVDTIGNCSVIDTKPSLRDISGLKILEDQSGYSSSTAAEQALHSDSSLCKGMIQRA